MLVELAERCEAATGPDRELDADIADPLPVCRNMNPRDTRGNVMDFVPAYTRSIDAALTLVPEGWDSCRVGNTDDGRGYAELAGNDAHMMNEDPDEFYVEGEAATPALALCAAALKALSHKESR